MNGAEPKIVDQPPDSNGSTISSRQTTHYHYGDGPLPPLPSGERYLELDFDGGPWPSPIQSSRESKVPAERPWVILAGADDANVQPYSPYSSAEPRGNDKPQRSDHWLACRIVERMEGNPPSEKTIRKALFSLQPGQEASLSDDSQTPFVVGVSVIRGVYATAYQPYIDVETEGTRATIALVDVRNQEVLLNATGEDRRIDAEVDTENVGGTAMSGASIQIPRVHSKRTKHQQWLGTGERFVLPLGWTGKPGAKRSIEVVNVDSLKVPAWAADLDPHANVSTREETVQIAPVLASAKPAVSAPNKGIGTSLIEMVNPRIIIEGEEEEKMLVPAVPPPVPSSAAPPPKRPAPAAAVVLELEVTVLLVDRIKSRTLGFDLDKLPASLDADKHEATLAALLQDGLAEFVMRPKITVLSGNKASVNVGSMVFEVLPTVLDKDRVRVECHLHKKSATETFDFDSPLEMRLGRTMAVSGGRFQSANGEKQIVVLVTAKLPDGKVKQSPRAAASRDSAGEDYRIEPPRYSKNDSQRQTALRQQTAARLIRQWGGSVWFSDKSYCRPDTGVDEYLAKTIIGADIGEEEKMIGAPDELSVKGCVEQLKEFPRLKVLTLTNDEVDDNMLVNVAQLSELKELYLFHCKVTDEGLGQVTGLTQLGSLVIRDTQITPAGIEAVRRALPHCKISFEPAALARNPSPERRSSLGVSLTKIVDPRIVIQGEEEEKIPVQAVPPPKSDSGAPANRPAPATAIENAGENYRIEPPDVIHVEVTRFPGGKTVLEGLYLVGPDGTINLRQYGVPNVAGLPVREVERQIVKAVSRHESGGEFSARVEVASYNSKVVYVMYSTKGEGDHVVRLPADHTSNVAGAILQVEGAAAQAAKESVWLARPKRNGTANPNGTEVKPIDWQAIVERGSVEANLPLKPGDRIFIGSRPPEESRDASPARGDQHPATTAASQAKNDSREKLSQSAPEEFSFVGPFSLGKAIVGSPVRHPGIELHRLEVLPNDAADLMIYYQVLGDKDPQRRINLVVSATTADGETCVLADRKIVPELLPTYSWSGGATIYPPRNCDYVNLPMKLEEITKLVVRFTELKPTRSWLD